MCCRTSSFSPVGTQFMLLGSPSAVKKSTQREREGGTESIHRKGSQPKDLFSLQLELLYCKGTIYLATGSQASVESVRSFHPWSFCTPPHISCHIWQLLPATDVKQHILTDAIKGLNVTERKRKREVNKYQRRRAVSTASNGSAWLYFR